MTSRITHLISWFGSGAITRWVSAPSPSALTGQVNPTDPLSLRERAGVRVKSTSTYPCQLPEGEGPSRQSAAFLGQATAG